MFIFALSNANDTLDWFVFLVLGLVAVTIALVAHEVAHGLVAKWNGDYTAKLAGRLTANPLKHFDPIGFVMMMLVGFGYAKPVPVNPYNYRNRRRGEITVAIAGVTTNLILAFFGVMFGCLMGLAYNHAVFDDAGAGVVRLCYYLYTFFQLFSLINLSLLFFNLLPVFPLDGFRLVEALTPRGNAYCRFMRTNGHYILYGLVGLSFIVSAAMSRVAAIPGWFSYINILGTYIDFFTSNVFNLFAKFWYLMIPLY